LSFFILTVGHRQLVAQIENAGSFASVREKQQLPCNNFRYESRPLAPDMTARFMQEDGRAILTRPLFDGRLALYQALDGSVRFLGELPPFTEITDVSKEGLVVGQVDYFTYAAASVYSIPDQLMVDLKNYSQSQEFSRALKISQQGLIHFLSVDQIGLIDLQSRFFYNLGFYAHLETINHRDEVIFIVPNDEETQVLYSNAQDPENAIVLTSCFGWKCAKQAILNDSGLAALRLGSWGIGRWSEKEGLKTFSLPSYLRNEWLILRGIDREGNILIEYSEDHFHLEYYLLTRSFDLFNLRDISDLRSDFQFIFNFDSQFPNHKKMADNGDILVTGDFRTREYPLPYFFKKKCF